MQIKATLVLFFSVIHTVNIVVAAQATDTQDNVPEHIVHPKINLPDLQQKSKLRLAGHICRRWDGRWSS